MQVTLQSEADYGEFRREAKRMLRAGVPPEQTTWRVGEQQNDLFATGAGSVEPLTAEFPVPRAFPVLARRVLCHRDPSRHALLYRLLWRCRRERGLLKLASDDDVYAATRMAKAVRRDYHKMKAFVRFRRVEAEEGEHYIAWFEPDHYIVKAAAPFFARRYTGMRWSILTPDASAHWDGEALRYAPGARRADCPTFDALENLWRTYYASIFNPARLKVSAMRAEMPRKYWKNLPEARLIPGLVREGHRLQRAAPAGRRVSTTKAEALNALTLERTAPTQMSTLVDVESGLSECRRCLLWRNATRPVAGEGPEDAKLVLVGEQPGDHEDRAGRPFVGPAGKVLDDAMARAGIARESIYLTNAVKHFKFMLRGKRRIHDKPGAGEIEHCRWWLNLELDIIDPEVVVALGASAARAVIGRPVRVGSVRGDEMEGLGGRRVLVTTHPSYILRLRNEAEKATQFDAMVQDLRAAVALLKAA